MVSGGFFVLGIGFAEKSPGISNRGVRLEYHSQTISNHSRNLVGVSCWPYDRGTQILPLNVFV